MRPSEGQTVIFVKLSGLDLPKMKMRRRIAGVVVVLLLGGGLAYNTNDSVKTVVDSFCLKVLELVKDWEPPDSIWIG